MKKKIFIQLHLFIIFINCFVLIAMFVGFNLIIRDPLLENQPKIRDGIGRIIAIIFFYLGFVYMIWNWITENHHWIVFKEKEIYVPNDLKLKCNRRQFKVVVRYDDILDISFITSKKNLKNKTIRDESSQAFAPSHHYLVIQKKIIKKKEYCLIIIARNKK